MAFETFIDADTHITEPADLWTSRVSSKWGDKVLHVKQDDKGINSWFVADEKVAAAPSGVFAGWKGKFPSSPPTYEEAHPASFDVHERLKLMDETGVYAQVLYPNVAGFASQRFLSLKDPELMLECVRAWNDFQLDWISVAPERFVANISIPFWDVEASVKEIERVAPKGMRGILFTGDPQSHGEPFLGDHHWDPLWNIATDAGLPISFHIGSGDFTDGFTPERLAVDGPEVPYARTSTVLFMANGLQMPDLLLSGVLPRFPDLKFISVESGIGWVPFCLESCDYHFMAADIRKARPEFEMMPSDYFRRQVYACYWFEKVAPRKLIDDIGADNILFETDFPHPTCLYGNVQETIEAGLSGQPEDVQRKILWENSAKLYNIEIPEVMPEGLAAAAAAGGGG